MINNELKYIYLVHKLWINGSPNRRYISFFSETSIWLIGIVQLFIGI